MGSGNLDLGVLGLGSYFRGAYLPKLLESASPFKIAALCRRDQKAMDEIARQLRNPTLHTSWQSFLAESAMDAVLISTPHHLHHDQVRAALDQGLHVLVDKPLCLDASEAEDLVCLAHRRNLVLSVAYNYHYWGHFRAARKWIASGKLGQITSVAVLGAARREGSPILDPSTWYHEPNLSGGGSMISGGTHRLEAVLWLTGHRPQSVFALMHGPTAQMDFQAGLVLELEEGVVVTLLNEAEAPARRLEISIYGERGAIFIRNDELEIVRSDGQPAEVEMVPETDALSDFYRAVVEGKPLVTSAQDGYWAVAAIQAAYQSAASGQLEAVRQPDFDWEVNSEVE